MTGSEKKRKPISRQQNLSPSWKNAEDWVIQQQFSSHKGTITIMLDKDYHDSEWFGHINSGAQKYSEKTQLS